MHSRRHCNSALVYAQRDGALHYTGARTMTESATIRKAVILARGLGTRMRSEDTSSALSREQSEAAAAGIKAMIPVGRPFLDYLLSSLADAGFSHICLVIGPEHGAVRDYYARIPAARIRVSFAVQADALGTANALLPAEAFTGDDEFLTINGGQLLPRRRSACHSRARAARGSTLPRGHVGAQQQYPGATHKRVRRRSGRRAGLPGSHRRKAAS